MLTKLPEPPSENPTVKAFVFGAVIVTSLVSIAGFAGRFGWILDLASHFRVQYVVVLLVLCLILVAIRLRRLAVIPGTFALLNLALVLPLYWGAWRAHGSPVGTARAMMMNVHTSNTDYPAVLGAIKHYAPDFLFLEEVDQRWMDALQPLDSEYHYAISRPRDDNFGVAFYSRHPFITSEILEIGRAGAPSVLVKLELQGRDLYILGTHPLPPVNAFYANFRDTQLAEIPGVVKTLDAPVLLLGDLNATPWSCAFRRLLRDSALLDGSREVGYQATWPVGMFPLLIPIDHCLHSPGIQIVRKEIGPAVGSDHYPVVVDFALSAPGAER